VDGKRNDVMCEQIDEDGEKRFKITTIIGAEDGLGVESLRGSGLIAGETSRAYEDIFTITLVTCRSVGMYIYHRLCNLILTIDRYRCLPCPPWPACHSDRRPANHSHRCTGHQQTAWSRSLHLQPSAWWHSDHVQERCLTLDCR
jgi:acetyl-CoA carboxylase/biotin carboxylase 1